MLLRKTRESCTRGTIHETEWASFDTSSHWHTALLILSGNILLSQCQSKNKLTHLWSPPEGQWALRSIFSKRNESGAEHGGDWRVSWCVAGIPSLMTDARAVQYSSALTECLWHQSVPHTITEWVQVGRGPSRYLIPAPCSKLQGRLLQVCDYSGNSLHAEIPRDTSCWSLL